MVQQARVREFREAHRLQDDADFAFHFSSFEEARARGGDFLATAWARVRAAEEEPLLPVEPEAVERRPPSVGTVSVVRPPKLVCLCPSSPSLRAAKDQPEQILQRVAGLKQVFMDAGVLKPRGDLNDAILNEWSTEVQRLAQDRVTQADKATIVNAVRTYAELKHFMTARVTVRCLQSNSWMVALRRL